MSGGMHVVFGDITGVPRTDAYTVAWSRAQFELLKDGGMWAVPRSGLIFQRRGDTLVLVQEMPWMDEMEGTVTREQLREQQDAEYRGIHEQFGLAGIPVSRDLKGEDDA